MARFGRHVPGSLQVGTPYALSIYYETPPVNDLFTVSHIPQNYLIIVSIVLPRTVIRKFIESMFHPTGVIVSLFGHPGCCVDSVKSS